MAKKKKNLDLYVRKVHKYGGPAHQATKTKLQSEDKIKYKIVLGF